MVFYRQVSNQRAEFILDKEAELERERLRADEAERRVGEAMRATEQAVRHAASSLALVDELTASLETAKARLEKEEVSRAESRFDSLIRRQVSVHTESNHTLEGFVKAVHKDAIVLAQARYFMDDGSFENLVGEQVIPFDKVAFISEGTAALTAPSA